MRYTIPSILFMVSLWLGSAMLLANTTVLKLADTEEVMPVGRYLQYLEDPTNAMQIQDILNASNWKQNKEQVAVLGLVKNTLWLKLDVLGDSSISKSIIEIDYPLIDQSILYIATDTKIVRVDSIHEFNTPTSRNIQVASHTYQLPVEELAGKQFQLFFKIRITEQTILPIKIYTAEQSFWQAQGAHHLFNGLYAGAVLVIILYNLFAFIMVKDRNYIIYIIMILFTALTQLAIQGYRLRYLFDISLLHILDEPAFTASVASIAGVLFAKKILQTRLRIFLFDRYVFNPLIILFSISTALSFIPATQQLSFGIMQLATLLLSISILGAALYLTLKGYKEAIWFSVAWGFLLSSAFLFILKDYGVLPYNFFTSHLMQIGSFVEMSLLSLAIGHRINLLQQEKTEALTQTQATRIEAQQAKLQFAQEREELIQQQHKELEDQINQRTGDLQKLNLKLKNRLVTVYDSRVSLSALGENAANISNNMRDPLSSMHQLTDALQLNVHDLLKLLQAYETIVEKGGMDDNLLHPIHELKAKLDINMAQQEIPKLFGLLDDSMHQAVTLVDEIHELANIRKDSYESASLNTIITNTINLFSQAQLQGIEVKQELGDVPPIDCLPGKLSHLLINILENAIDSIHARITAGEKGCITIRTTHKQPSRQIELTIQDNGVGSTGTYWKKTIEPFKTKKAHGQGIGLTSISRIASLHKAGLALNLQKWGATLTILFPIEQPSAYPHEKLYETPSFENLEIDIDE